MGGYTDGEYNGGMAESSADYGGGITYEENQQYKVHGFPGSIQSGRSSVKLNDLSGLDLVRKTWSAFESNGLRKWKLTQSIQDGLLDKSRLRHKLGGLF